MRSNSILALAGAFTCFALVAGPQANAETTAAATSQVATTVQQEARPQSVVRLAQSDAYRPPSDGYGSGQAEETYRPPANRGDDAYRPPQDAAQGYGSGSAYNSGPPPAGDDYGRDNRYNDGTRDDAGTRGRSAPPSGGYGEPYAPPGRTARHSDPAGSGYPEPQGPEAYDDRRHYSKNEIIDAGHGFFGSISQGLASVIEHAFKKGGRPNGYILGEDAGGAFVAGLRYGEGRLYTKDAGSHKVYWQGPSIGYDFGGAGAKTMILVYNLRDPSEIYHRFGGVEGSAYLIGGVSIQFQKYGDVVMAPIRAGVGLRLGANVGYLKYTRRPTWNPF